MFLYLAITFLISAVVGLGIKFYTDRNKSYQEITWPEFGLTLVAVNIFLLPIMFMIGWHISKEGRMTYKEYLNGWEESAVTQTITCTRDGPCRHEYSCDPYIVMVTYPCGCTKSGCSTCLRPETRYHSCPYVTHEMNYYVNTSLGQYTIAEHRFPENYQSARWRKSKVVSETVAQQAGVGAPIFWTQAKARIDSGQPGPVTKKVSYKNYFYAADASILRREYANIQMYMKHLPLPDTVIKNFYELDKIYFVGVAPPESVNRWIRQTANVAAGLGKLEGDIRIVLINSSFVSDPDAYTLALKAYWQHSDILQKNAIAKNAIVFVFGIENNSKISWARSFSTMPKGNEAIDTETRTKFVGVPLDVDSIVGNVRRNNGRLVYSGGVAPMILGSGPARYRRENMENYKYLSREIGPTTTAKVGLFITALVLSIVGWGVPLYTGVRISYYKHRW